MLTLDQMQQARQSLGSPPSGKVLAGGSQAPSSGDAWGNILNKGKTQATPVPTSPQDQTSQPQPSDQNQPKEEGGLLHNIWEGTKSVVSQPGEFLQKAGTGLGDYLAKQLGGPSQFEKDLAKNLGFTPENAEAAHQQLLKNVTLNSGQSQTITPYKNLRETAGGGIQAISNLATPELMALGPVGQGIQSGLTEAGQSLEQDKSNTEALAHGAGGFALGTILGKGTEFGGKALTEGATNMLKEQLAPIVDKAIPFLTNIPKASIDFAKENAHLVVPKWQAVAKAVESGDMSTAESALRKDLLDKAQVVHGAAKQTAQEAYQKGVSEAEPIANKFIAKNPTQAPNKEALSGAVRALAKEQGPSIHPDAQRALEAIHQSIKDSDPTNFKGLVGLKRNIGQITDQLEQGTPEHRVSSLMEDTVDKELSRVTGGKMDKVNADYAAFKNLSNQVKPIWSRGVTEDSARNFVNSLENTSKGGAHDAMKELAKMGGMDENLIKNELKANKVARALNWEKAPPGSRMRDTMVSGLFQGTGAGIGGLAGSMFGPGGAVAGAGFGGALGNTLGAKMTSPRNLSKFLFNDLEKIGTKIPGPLRQQIGKLVSNPATAQVLLRGLNHFGHRLQ